jgi:hypothetical protein
MNQFAQSTFVAAIRQGARKGRFDAPAKSAPGLDFNLLESVGRKQASAAN